MINERLKAFRDILKECDSKVYHYVAPATIKRYVLWKEDGASSSLYGDDKKQEQALDITVDFFTDTEYDDTVDILQCLFNANNISYTLTDCDYEYETNLIHYQWRVSF